MISKKERDDYFKLVRIERIRLGKDPSEKIIAALHQADARLKKAELEKQHPSKEDIESAIDESKSSDTDINK